MSHFIGLVFGNNVDKLLSPYDENKEVAPYIKYTKEEAIDEVKRRHASCYEFAVKFVEDHKNPTLDWEKKQLEESNKVIEKGLFISYEDAWEEAKNWGYEIDEEENLLSTYNPDSKWDWWSYGGRWEGFLILKEKAEDGHPYISSNCDKGEVDWDTMFEEDKIPFCFITENGEWHETAKMGWWDCTSDDKEEEVWKKEFKDYLDTVGDNVEVNVIDFHI